MPSRREFIQAGLVVSIAPVALPIPTIESLAARVDVRLPAHRPLYCVVLDVRSPWTGDLAREARRLGIKVVRTSGDITDFWYRDLSVRWKDATGRHRRRDRARSAVLSRAVRVGSRPARGVPRRGWRPCSRWRDAPFVGDRSQAPGGVRHACRCSEVLNGDSSWRQRPRLAERTAAVHAGGRRAVGLHERRRHRAVPRRVLAALGRKGRAAGVGGCRAGHHRAGVADRPHGQSLPDPDLSDLHRQEPWLRRLGPEPLGQRGHRPQADEPRGRGR